MNLIRVTHALAPEPIEIHSGFRVTRSHPKHWHEEFHMCAVTGGDGYLDFRGSSMFTPVGTLFVLAPGVVHANHTDGDGCTYKNIYVPPKLVERAASQVGSGGIPEFPVLTERRDIVQAFLRMVLVLENAPSSMHRESAVLMFFAMLTRRLGDRPTVQDRCAREPKAVKIVREFLHENYDREIGLDELSALTCLSPFHLNRTFRRELGIPPHAYQIQMRIARAKTLLRESHPIADVALRTGFADQSHLTRHFKRMVGVTPGEFNRQSKNIQDPEISLA